jgi:hypothetical protein
MNNVFKMGKKMFKTIKSLPHKSMIVLHETKSHVVTNYKAYLHKGSTLNSIVANLISLKMQSLNLNKSVLSLTKI